MKNNLLILIAMFLISFSSFGNSNKIPNMGLAGEMIYNKVYAENKMYILLNDSLFTKNHRIEVDSLILKYQRLQSATDQIVMALTSTLKSFARPRVYKKIDKALFKSSLSNLNDNNPRVKGIENGLKEVARLFDDLSNYIERLTSPSVTNSQNTIKMIGIAELDVMAIFGHLLDLYKDSRERAANKASALSDLVQELRLNPINNLLNKTEPKKEEKETAQASPKLQQQ